MATSTPQVIVHPMVEYLNSLRTQERDTNPSYVHENRRAYLEGLRAQWPGFPTEEALHVRTRLDDFADALAAGRVDVDAVFLTGDAGDGKTALCNRVAAALTGTATSLVEPIKDVCGWTIVKDASEVRLTDMTALLERHLVLLSRNLDRDPKM